LFKDVDFVGRSAVLHKRDQWRENKLVMLKVEDNGISDLEGNESVWLEGKVNNGFRDK